jgi:hypothetical protein
MGGSVPCIAVTTDAEQNRFPLRWNLSGETAQGSDRLQNAARARVRTAETFKKRKTGRVPLR